MLNLPLGTRLIPLKNIFFFAFLIKIYCIHIIMVHLNLYILTISLINIEDKQIKVTIWDTAGQDRFRAATNA